MGLVAQWAEQASSTAGPGGRTWELLADAVFALPQPRVGAAF